MKQRGGRLGRLLACGSAALTLWGGISLAQGQSSSAGLFEDKVVARGDGIEVRESEVDEAFIQFKASIAARGDTVDPSQRDDVKKKILDRLISEKILLKMAQPGDQQTGNAEADAYIAKAQDQAGSMAAYERQLLTLGMNRDRFEGRIHEKMVMDKVLERTLRSTITVSDTEVKKFYDENPERFEIPEKVSVQHILVGTFDPQTRQPYPDGVKAEKRRIADKLRERAVGGEDFGKLAKDYSDDHGASGPGGEYTFSRGMMDPTFEAAAFAMRAGEISGIVETPYGFHIIKMLSREPGKKLSFTEVQETLKEGLIRKKFEDQLEGYLAGLRKDAHVQIVQ